jgi:hypothetical protein
MRGDDIHAAAKSILTGQSTLAMDPDYVETAQGFIAKLKARIGEFHVVAVENRYTSGCLTGQPDLLALDENGCLHIADWKSGWGDVPEAAVNAQVRGYVVLVSIAYGDNEKEIMAHIVTPKGITSVAYSQ